MNKRLLLIHFLAVSPLIGQTPYVVDEDLGDVINTTTTISGDTSSEAGPVRDNARFHQGLTESNGNWGNERVYGFRLSVPSRLELRSTSITGDPDFFLLESLATRVTSSEKSAAIGGLALAYLDGAAPETIELGAFPPGVYYLAAEHFMGFDGGVEDGDSQYTVELIASPATLQELTTSIGHLGVVGAPVLFSTLESPLDTVIAVYDSAGNVIATDDDSGQGNSSSLAFDGTLPAGTYFLYVGGSGSTFEDNFSASPGSTEGGFNMFYLKNGAAQLEEGIIDTSFDATALKIYEFTIAEQPAVLADLGVIANDQDPVFFDLALSDFDTQLAIYNSNGYLVGFNDDADFANDIFTSYLEYPNGIPAGFYYLGIFGYDSNPEDGFVFDSSEENDSGNYSLAWPGDDVTGTLEPGEARWFFFEIEASDPVVPRFEATIANLDVANNLITLTWENTSETTYAIESSTDGVDFAPVPGETGLTDTATFSIDLVNNPTLLFRVVEEVP